LALTNLIDFNDISRGGSAGTPWPHPVGGTPRHPIDPPGRRNHKPWRPEPDASRARERGEARMVGRGALW